MRLVALNRDPIIIVGTGRCGSTALTDVVRTNPRWLSLSEVFSSLAPNAFPAGRVRGKDWADMLARPRFDSKILLEHHLEDSELLYPIDDERSRFDRHTGVPPLLISALPHLVGTGDDLLDEICDEVRRWRAAGIERHYQRLFEWLRRRFAAERWIERSGGSLVCVDRLIEAFPEARFVHIWRDGLECTLSMSRHTGFRLLMLREQVLRRFGIDPFVDDERPPELLASPYAAVCPERFDPEAFVQLEVPLSKFAGVWSRLILLGVPLLRNLPADRLLELSYAELVDDPADTIRRLQLFIDGEVDEAWVAAAARKVGPSRPPSGLDAVDRRTRQICDAGLQIILDAA
jgi:Sulfotransferase family